MQAHQESLENLFRCVSIFDHDRLQTTVGPADVAVNALRVCVLPLALGLPTLK